MKLLILGGDRRQELLKNILSENHKVCHYFTEDDFKKDFGDFDTIILPYPASRDGKTLFNPLGNFKILLKEIDEKITFQKVLSGGNVPIKNSVNYAESEMLLMMNAALTAEAAIALAIMNTDIALQKSKCLIIGNGRIGKVLADRLSGFNAKVTVSARKESDFAYLSSFGYPAVKTKSIADYIHEFDIIFNTVPFEVINENALEKCKKDAVLIELASFPYGFNREAAEKTGLKVILASALPGKTAPKTAAAIIGKVINGIL